MVCVYSQINSDAAWLQGKVQHIQCLRECCINTCIQVGVSAVAVFLFCLLVHGSYCEIPAHAILCATCRYGTGALWATTVDLLAYLSVTQMA